jgi:signal transduction histidine kinase/CheY-like chemotaxis protein
MPGPSPERVLILAPVGRDAEACAQLLGREDIHGEVCRTASSLVEDLDLGAGTVLVAEEALSAAAVGELANWVGEQAAWSDLPFILLTSHRDDPRIRAWRQGVVERLRNVSMLERPVQSVTLTSTVLAAVRARRRQYEVRELLDVRERAERELQSQIAEATRELREQMAERSRIEASLRQVQKIEAIGQLTGGIAHDFNNLLMIITSGLNLMERRPEMGAKLVEQMRHAAQRGAGLTRQLLAFSRKQDLKPQAIALPGLVEGMRDLLARSLRGDIAVEMSFAPELWPVEVDPGQLELVTLNFALNARDAMPGGGTITIACQNEPSFSEGPLSGDFVRLSVTDTGEGMEPEVLARVFEPFFTTKEVGKGSGLGLAQAFGFARQSGGTVQISSELGRGTTVSLYLPRSHAVLRAPVPDDRQPMAQVASSTILLVEDDDEVAAMVSEMLQELGHEVVRTASAAAALGALADQRAVDLVLSDIMMPGDMDGVALAEQIKLRRPKLPVLLTSGYPEAIQRVQAMGVHFLQKPYDIRQLADSIAELRSTPDTAVQQRHRVG